MTEEKLPPSEEKKEETPQEEERVDETPQEERVEEPAVEETVEETPEVEPEHKEEFVEDSHPMDVSSDDKLWAALGYPIPLIAIIVLFMEDKKDRPFIRYHAVQALAFNVALWLLIFIVSAVTLGIGAICAPLLWLVTLWPAYDAYKGNLTEIPVVTNFIKNQGWV